MKHLLPISLLALFLLVLFIIIHSVRPQKAAFSRSIEKEVTVSATLGAPLLTLFGYTAPKAKVEVSGLGVYAQTESDNRGYFEFVTIFTFPSTRELCLTSFDHKGRSTNPVCIPTYLSVSKKRSVGPVILPPTISVGKGKFLPNETIEASGQSLPETEISVSLFRAEPTLFGLERPRLASVAYAASLPTYTIKTDQNGYFSFNLPSTTANVFRLFTQAKFENSPSPKSNTLTFKVLSIFEYFIEKIKLLFLLVYRFLKNLPILETIIFGEFILLFLLFYRSRQRKLMVIEKDIQRYGEGRKLIIPN